MGLELGLLFQACKVGWKCWRNVDRISKNMIGHVALMGRWEMRIFHL